MKLTYKIPEPYYVDKTCIYYLCKSNGEVFYVGKTVSPAGRMSSHRETYGKTTQMFVYKVVPDSKWKIEEVKAIKAFKKAGYKLVNDNKGGAGAERGHSKLFNITKFLTNWTESHRVTFNSKTIDTIKMIYQRLKKDKQSDIRYLLESFCLTVVFHMRKTNVESLYDQIYARHITDMKKLYPKYSMSID